MYGFSVVIIYCDDSKLINTDENDRNEWFIRIFHDLSHMNTHISFIFLLLSFYSQRNCIKVCIIIRLVNQTIIKISKSIGNDKILHNEYPTIMCAIDEIIEFLIFSTRSSILLDVYYIYMTNVFYFTYNKNEIWSNQIFTCVSSECLCFTKSKTLTKYCVRSHFPLSLSFFRHSNVTWDVTWRILSNGFKAEK